MNAKNRKLDYKESKETVYPYTSLPNKNSKCKEHVFKTMKDGQGHFWIQCERCSKLK